MQTIKYSPEQEQSLMAELWSPIIANDPESFVLFAFPWGQVNTPLERHTGPRKWQRRVLREVANHIKANDGLLDFSALRLAIASGRGIGKSALVSWLVLWMLSTRVGSTVIVSANSENQLRSVTWGEITKWSAMIINSHWWEISATKLTPAAWLTTLVERDLSMGTRYWAAEGKLWSAENPDAYAGVHNDRGMMVIYDESSGIDDKIWAVAAGFFTENIVDRYWLVFSNPRRNSGYFFEAVEGVKRGFWTSYKIDSRTVEGTDKSIYQGIIDEFGEDSDEARVEVYGEFPSSDTDHFISPAVVDAAFKRQMYNDTSLPIIIGVDPARGGADSTVMAVRQGRDILAIRRFKGDDTMTTVGRVIDVMKEFKPAMVFIDEGGLGYGVLDRLTELRYRVRGVNFGWRSSNPTWGNKRAEMWGDMKAWLRTAYIAADNTLRADLIGPTSKPDSTGTIFLESKKDMKRRGLASPDSADAIALTHAFPVSSEDNEVISMIKSRHTSEVLDYDPFSMA